MIGSKQCKKNGSLQPKKSRIGLVSKPELCQKWQPLTNYSVKPDQWVSDYTRDSNDSLSVNQEWALLVA